MNPPFPRPAEPPIKPQYIVLFKGDDSDFQGNQSVDVVIDTELDTTGMKAHFRFMDFVQDFDSIPENKTLSLVFPNAKTSEFPLGAADATLRFEDASGKFRTISNRIHIVVTNSVHEAYDNEDSQSITVTVKGTVTWDMIEDKPTIPAPVTIDTALSTTSENPVQNKAVAKALYTGFTEWVCDSISDGWTFVSCEWKTDAQAGTGWFATVNNGFLDAYVFMGTDAAAVALTKGSSSGFPALSLFRHLITPTKTSQLTNDGPSSGPNAGHPFATTNQIPAPVDISGKLDGAAAYPAWESAAIYGTAGTVVSHAGRLWRNREPVTELEPGASGVTVWEEVFLKDLKQDALSSAQMAAVNSGATAAKVAAWDGYAAQIAQKANASDVNAALAQKANAADLPYAMVTPGEWEFSGGSYGQGYYIIISSDGHGGYNYDLYLAEDDTFITEENKPTDDVLSVFFEAASMTATRPSLPGHLCDRAVNAVPVSTDTELTLPALVNAGKARDFLVRLAISGSTVPTVTFAAPTGETITYETDGEEFPVPDEAGTWLYSFTETAAHTFAVSLKKVNVVAQGGS